MNTAIYALMHFLVDFICAWAMFGFFCSGEAGYLNILIYNFCAFALQMPLGTALDLARGSAKGRLRRMLAPIWTGIGVVLTIAGALLHPAVLGLGNALFHVGGGMDVIQEDFGKKRKGRNLGIFVAPGAIGLFCGTRLGKSGPEMAVLIALAAALTLLMGVLLWRKQCCVSEWDRIVHERKESKIWRIALCCFMVVILRSWVGLSVSFSWKTEPILGFVAVLAVALGKALGGLVSARFGMEKTIRWSLILAAVCYVLGEIPGFGMAALLLFNMSMPVTLYLLAESMPKLPGFSFGLLTFGLFLGFLPVYAGVELPISGTFFGAIGSVISLLLLAAAGKAVPDDCKAM